MRPPPLAPFVLVPVLAAAALAASPASAVPLTGGISGTVTADGTGTPLEGVEVYSDLGGYDITDAQGRYTLTELDPGDHVVRFDPYFGAPEYVFELFDDADTYETATPVPVGSTVVTGIDAGLAVGGRISGTVETGGVAAADVDVFAYSQDDRYGGYAMTGTDGTYEITGLGTGSYVVVFDDPGDLATQYYDGALTYDTATPVPVVEGAGVTGIDATLVPGGSVSGTVTDSTDGTPVADVVVQATSLGSDATEYAYTDVDGTYVLRGVLPGATVVEFADYDERYLGEWFDDAPTLDEATPVTVVLGQDVPDVDAALDIDPLGPSSSYVVTDPVRVLQPTALDAGGTRTLTLEDAPVGATAVALNVTVSGVTANTYVSACPPEVRYSVCSQKSIINSKGPDTANFVLLKMGGDDGNQVRFSNNAGSVNLIADLQGFMVDDRLVGFPAGGQVEAASAGGHPDLARTRTDVDLAGAGAQAGLAAALVSGPASYQASDPVRVLEPSTVTAGGTRTLTVPDVPVGATAVALNLTVSGVTANTYVSACLPETTVAVCKAKSIINSRGPDTANFVVLPLGGPDGDQVKLYNNAGSVKLIADLQGYMVGDDTGCGATEVLAGCAALEGTAAAAVPSPAGRYLVTDPVRVLQPTAVGPKGTRTLTLTGVPDGATAVALTVTVSGVTANTYVSACPPEVAVLACSQKSIINSRGPDTANFVVLKLGGPNGDQVRFSNNAGSVNLIADLQGWFVGPVG